jgi:hypothetical protein
MLDAPTGGTADIPVGSIFSVASDGNLTLSLSENRVAEVGDRFDVRDAQGKSIAEITVIEADDESGVVARPFQPLVSPNVLSSATGGAAVGAVIGSMVAPALASVIGSAIGAYVGARGRRKNSPRIEVGMKVFSASTDSAVEG